MREGCGRFAPTPASALGEGRCPLVPLRLGLLTRWSSPWPLARKTRRLARGPPGVLSDARRVSRREKARGALPAAPRSPSSPWRCRCREHDHRTGTWRPAPRWWAEAMPGPSQHHRSSPGCRGAWQAIPVRTGGSDTHLQTIAPNAPWSRGRAISRCGRRCASRRQWSHSAHDGPAARRPPSRVAIPTADHLPYGRR